MQYTVKANDSLSKIARDVLGNINLWPEIASANNIVEPYTIFPGQRLQLPDIPTAPVYKGGAGKGMTMPGPGEALPTTGAGLMQTVQKNLPLIALALVGAYLLWWGFKK